MPKGDDEGQAFCGFMIHILANVVMAQHKGFVGGACSPESNGECGCVAVRGCKLLLHIHLAWLFRGYKPLLHGFFAATLGFVGGACSPE